MRARSFAGLAVILVGFLFVGGVVGLATVPSFFGWGRVYPNGSASQPLMMTADVPIELNVTVSYSGAPSATYWDVYATVTWDEGSEKVDMGAVQWMRSTLEYEEEKGGKTIYYHASWETSWTPKKAGTDYKFDWKAEIRNYDGTLVVTKSKVSYARTLDVTDPAKIPDGYFLINGKSVKTVSSITLDDPKLTVEFAPTQAPENIDRVYVEVFNKSAKVTTLTISSTGTDYTLPAYGTYDLKGYVVPESPEDPLYKMGLSVEYPAPDGGDGGDGGDEPGEEDFFTINSVLGVVLIGVGAFILLTGRKQK